MQEKTRKPMGLNLEVTEIERRGRAGCCTSSTNPACTCPVRVTVCGTCVSRVR